MGKVVCLIVLTGGHSRKITTEYTCIGKLVCLLSLLNDYIVHAYFKQNNQFYYLGIVVGTLHDLFNHLSPPF